MGVYAVTGGSSGIGAAVVELLRKDGHEVINIDLKNGDICANLATVEGRQAAIDGLYERCPKGLDRKSTRLNSSHYQQSRMPSSA